MNKSANMYGLLKAAAPIDAEGNGTGNPWNEYYASNGDRHTHIEDSIRKSMGDAGYSLDRALKPGKNTAFQGGYKPGFGRAITQAARNAIHTSNATAPVKLDALKEMNSEFIHDTSNFAHNPYGMDRLQVQGTDKTLGETAKGWMPAKPRTFSPKYNTTFGAPPLVQAPQVRR